MLHRMKLLDQPFKSMKEGRKTVEVRLNDDKRRKLKVGDEIEFVIIPKLNESLFVEILELHTYSSFKEMYSDIPAEAYDAKGKSIQEMVESTYTIYTREQERKWGTLAITVNVIK
ncbi:ASCH domain-containing protein [Bacillus shivajii]|uniref:ASCH domain-containing protein n=1 Tax=Bacillus shivajii TaxID=1983719 RepID=UPI001CF94AA6|nr:ASCH domain-containing protein [Bacillus shivajii]UCZ52165.1 ASCH domain-containing protein [Bacillus shivajii]